MSKQERENETPEVGDNLAPEEGDYIPDPQSPKISWGDPHARGEEEVTEEGSDNPQEFGPRIRFGEEQQ